MATSLNIKIDYLTLLKFALPTIIANIFMSMFTTLDGIFVSNVVGTDALSAVNIVMPFLMIVIALGTMIGTGGSANVAAQIGEKKEREAKETFSMLIAFCFITSLIISICALVYREPLLYLLGANDVIFEYSMTYAIPLFCIAPLALLGIAFQTFFIAAGKPALGMAFSVIGGLINLVLDYFLIVVMNMGVLGAALATGIGYSFPAVAGLLYFTFCRKGSLCFVKPKIKGKVLLQTLTNGSSEMVAMLSSGITVIMMNNIVMGLVGEDGVAAISILNYSMTLLTSIYIGYAIGVSPVISFNFGAKNTDNLKKIHSVNLRMIILASVMMYALGLLLRKPIISIFADSASDVYALANEGFILFSIGFLFMGFNMYTSALFTALGNGKVSAGISFCRVLLFLTIALLTLPKLFGINGLWMAMPIAEFLGVFLGIVFIMKYKEKYHYA